MKSDNPLATEQKSYQAQAGRVLCPNKSMKVHQGNTAHMIFYFLN